MSRSADLSSPRLTALAPLTLDFDPARDGFSFPNRFAWTDDDLTMLSARLRPLTSIPFALAGGVGGLLAGRRTGGLAGLGVGAALGTVGVGDGVVRTIAQRWPTFGLCGGMALLAIERWPQRGRQATADLEPAPLRALLRRSQERTLRASLPRFAAWWARALRTRGPYGTWPDALRDELDRIDATLRAGRPVLLGVVGDAPDPFSLHQVVAYGLERRGPIDATLQVYDPNAPRTTRSITIGPGPEAGQTRISTTIPTGPGRDGRARISSRPDHLYHVFAIDVPS